MAEETTTPIHRRWTREEALANPDLSGSFLIFVPRTVTWYLRPNGGTTPDRAEAHIYDYAEAVRIMGWDDRLEELMTQPAAPPPPPPRTSEVEPIRLTKQQLLNNMDSLSRKQTLIWQQGMGYYKQPLGTGHTFDLDLALRCSCHQAQQYSGVTYELVDQEAAAEILKRKCSITTILGKSLVELLQAAPLNPTGRARILAITGLMPPDTITSFDELKAWVESNCEPKSKPGSRPAPGQTVVPAGFQISLRFTETEHGTCTYTLPRRTTANYQIGAGTIMAACLGQTNISEVTNNLLQHILDNAWEELDIETDSDGEYDYEYNDENSECNNQLTTLRNGAEDLQARIVSFLRQTNPELLRQLQTPF